MSSRDQLIDFNGVDPETGAAMIQPVSVAELARRIKERAFDRAAAAAARRRESDSQPKLDTPLDENPNVVGGPKGGGWGIVFHKDEDPAVCKALEKLITHRRQQVDPARFKSLVYTGSRTAYAWLQDNGVGNPGDVEPWVVPRYLLVVGCPQRIPYAFVRGLPTDYAVGVLSFDRPEEYAAYAETLVQHETGGAAPRAREVAYFRTQYDAQTERSAASLVDPLADGLPAQPNGAPARPPVTAGAGYGTRKVYDDNATAAAFASLLGSGAGAARPALLFAATHGASVGGAEPAATAGAIICQDKQLFGARQLAALADADVHGLCLFLNACFSGGTPEYDEFPDLLSRLPLRIVEKPFLAALPKALLSRPQGGAIACIGHVEKAFTSAFVTIGQANMLAYRNAMLSLLGGRPIGLALRPMRDRAAAAEKSLADVLGMVHDMNLDIDDMRIVRTWCERNEAAGYILIGDPAARLQVAAA